MKLPLFALLSSLVVGVDANLRGDVVARLLQETGQACVASDPAEQVCTADGPKPECTPFRSPDYCGPELSFSSLISKRTSYIKANPEQVVADGWWLQNLDDKIASYVYSAASGLNPPNILDCAFDIMAGLDEFAARSGGFVIRATDLHSTKGIYVLPEGFNGVELIRGMNMTLMDVKTDLDLLGATKLILEEYVAGPNDLLPVEYKFHVFDGEIGSINIFYGRGTDCNCWAEMDENGKRLDEYGCFAPTGTVETTGQCNVIDFVAGSKKPFPIKGVDLCSAIPDIEPCIFQDMINLAKKASSDIGAYIRVDMFVGADGKVHVQEFSTNHLNGLRHCSAKLLPNGCIDSCFLGAMWQDLGSTSNALFGGRKPPTPSALASFLALPDEASKCQAAVDLQATPPLQSTCDANPIETPSPSGAPSPSIPVAPPAICPVAAPLNATFCALPSTLTCSYDESCCSEDICFDTNFCSCRDGEWLCNKDKEIDCDFITCPEQAPAFGATCNIPMDIICAYDPFTCSDSSVVNTTFCYCNNFGEYVCDSALECGTTEPVDLDASTAPSTSPSTFILPPPAVCPIDAPVNATSCALPSALTCGYDESCCAEDICFDTNFCSCRGGEWLCNEDKAIDCDFITCPEQAPEFGVTCNIPMDIVCYYDPFTCPDNSVVNTTFCYCNNFGEYVCDSALECPQAPEPSAAPIAPPSAVCPADTPENGGDCSLSVDVKCDYNEFCCNANLCFNTTFASCTAGNKWQLFVASVVCDEDGCPLEKPSTGDTCAISETLSCEYDLSSCADGTSVNTTLCTCEGGEYVCGVSLGCSNPAVPGTAEPSFAPSVTASVSPTAATAAPSATASDSPTPAVGTAATAAPSVLASATPSATTPAPSVTASATPTAATAAPSVTASDSPTAATPAPSVAASDSPTAATPAPSVTASDSPTVATPAPSVTASDSPTAATPAPSIVPSVTASDSPTPAVGTDAPSVTVSATPTAATPAPSVTASATPTAATPAPSVTASATPTAATPAPSVTASATPTAATPAPSVTASATPTAATPAPSVTASGAPSEAPRCPLAALDGSACSLPAYLECDYDLINCPDGTTMFTIKCNCVAGVFTCESVQACDMLNVDIPIRSESMMPSQAPFTQVNIPKPQPAPMIFGGGQVMPGVEVSDKEVSSFTAIYSVTFNNFWTATNHPIDYPAGAAHWSKPVMAAHNDEYRMWEAGGLASDGVEVVAESGATITLEQELSAAGSGVGDRVVGKDQFNDDVQFQILSITLNSTHPYCSAISMIAPSPDWISGFYNLKPSTDGKWWKQFQVYTQPFDAGTEDGGTYSINNAASNPQAEISEITAAAAPSSGAFVKDGEVKPVGGWIFTLMEEDSVLSTIAKIQEQNSTVLSTLGEVKENQAPITPAMTPVSPAYTPAMTPVSPAYTPTMTFAPVVETTAAPVV